MEKSPSQCPSHYDSGSNNEDTAGGSASNKNNSVDVEDHRNKNKKKKKKKKQQRHSLDHLKQRVSALMSIFEEHDLFVPLPDYSLEKGKVWSNRNYGQDKKRQRKASERAFLEGRIEQLEACLMQHNLLNTTTS